MLIRHVSVLGFRGIRHLEWAPVGRVSCLVGPGDSTKTTILDAVELALMSRWMPGVSDADYYGGRPQMPIDIRVTVGDLPADIIAFQRFGDDLRGWSVLKRELHDEATGDDDLVITVRFEASSDVDPHWSVYTDRNEPRRLSWRDREAFRLLRLGPDIDRHLSWVRGSALVRVIPGSDELSGVLLEAYREAREAVDRDCPPSLAQAASAVQRAATELGVATRGTYRPSLDPSFGISGPGALTLHDDKVPVRQFGLGTRRLAALGAQLGALRTGSIVLLDEIEHGLEPHRLRHLLNELLKAATETQGQVIATTHAELPLQELPVDALCIVRSQGGETSVRGVPPALTGSIRRSPAALLAKSILVCEGKTEIALARAWEDLLWRTTYGTPAAERGAVLIDGEGSRAPQRGIDLARLGYRTALFADSDDPTTATEADLFAAGCTPFRWSGTLATEQRVALDLPLDALQEAVALAVEEIGLDSVVAAVRDRLSSPVSTAVIQDWLAAGNSEGEIRSGLGLAAKGTDDRPSWFKNVRSAYKLGKVIALALPRCADSELGRRVNALGAWMHD